ncbi:hypothetical protein [Candidatus Magnetaquicoccus inordinatus]|uniref:hypothetical protein n=1 Tax=Candidatus Magnetaquicoccus inordinatus TaxID=2496818 RepID=UPI00102AB91A|nr:hypothetical protein [Candidatus Magnetaquicoccus inordinatus]
MACVGTLWHCVADLPVGGARLRVEPETRQAARWCGRRSRVAMPSEANNIGFFGVDGSIWPEVSFADGGVGGDTV